jgi:glycosyltransferase involved in cell wall biosynthesis
MMSCVRLAVVAEQLRAAVPGGTGRYTRELLDALTATRGGDDVRDWYAPGAGRGVLTDEVRRPALAELWRRGLGPAPRHADVVFAPTPLAPPRRGRPLVVTIHDAVPWSAPETLTPRGARWHRDIGRRIATSADVVITPTAATAKELRRYLPLRRVEVVGEGVSPAIAAVPADLAARAERLGLPPAYALAVGTVEPRKGFDVAAAALSNPQWPDLPLVMVGPAGWGEVTLSSGRALHRLGRLSDADLATAYARASVFVMPSRAEGFGLPVLEAMAHGVPVVISDAPALVEVAGQAAVVVPRGDPRALAAGVRQALAERERLSRLGRARSGDYSWELAARNLWQICRDLLETSVHNCPR